MKKGSPYWHYNPEFLFGLKCSVLLHTNTVAYFYPESSAIHPTYYTFVCSPAYIAINIDCQRLGILPQVNIAALSYANLLKVFCRAWSYIKWLDYLPRYNQKNMYYVQNG